MFSPTDTIVAIATAPVRPALAWCASAARARARRAARAILAVTHDLEPQVSTLTHVREAQSWRFQHPIPNPEACRLAKAI